VITFTQIARDDQPLLNAWRRAAGLGALVAGLIAAPAAGEISASQAVPPAQPPAPARPAPAQPAPGQPAKGQPGSAKPGPVKPAAPPNPATAASAAPTGAPSAKELVAAIDNLGKLDYATRVAASRTVRRAPAEQAVPVLVKTVGEHADGYVRFRALVLLAGFNDPRARDLMLSALDDPNDRLREVAYSWLEVNPEPALASKLIAKLDKELSEFVRPSLVRTLAALGADPAVQKVLVREAGRGQDFFRSTVIEALGEHKAAYALPALTAIAKLDGPLQDDAVIALGQIGDKRALEAITPLQRTAPRDRQPSIATAICLLGVNCESHERFLTETLRFTLTNIGFQDLARAASRGLAELAKRGRASAWEALIEIGTPAVDPVRAPIALSLATAAIGNPEALLAALGRSGDEQAARLLLRDGFDMLAEDFVEERFYADVRRRYWKAPAGSPSRVAIERVITTLDF
jgi:HEAT repeat protein